MSARGFAAIGLHHPKDAANVGGVMRAAGCYGASLVAIQGARYSKAPTDVGQFFRHRPVLHVEHLRDAIPFGAVPVAIELVDGARPLHTYTHPASAFYVFGPEDGTLGREVLSWCRDVVYVPTAHCMNLAACVNVVLYDRAAKTLRDAQPLRRIA